MAIDTGMIKTEEKRIIVSHSAIPNDPNDPNEQVSELSLALACELVRLQNAKPSWPRRHSSAYQEAAEEICRLSRKIIWQFVRSAICDPSQVRSVAEQFDDASTEINPDCGTHPNIMKSFQQEIRNRAAQLRVALDDFDARDGGGAMIANDAERNDRDIPQKG